MFPVIRTSLLTTGFITLLVPSAIALAAGPVITPIPLQTFVASEDMRTITVEVSNPNQDQITYSARIVSFGHAAGLVLSQNQDYRNWGGLDEKWVQSKDNTWYFLTPDGSLYEWNKSPQTAFVTGPVIGKFPPSFHSDLSLLINQPDADVQAAGNVLMNGRELTVNMVTGSSFGIEVTAQDTSGDKAMTAFGVVRPMPIPEGSLFVRQGNTSLPQQLLGGTTGESALELEFRAVRTDISVRELRIEVFGPSASTGDGRSIDSLQLFRRGVATPFPFAVATKGACAAANVAPGTFCAVIPDTALIVQPDTDVIVQVRPKMKTDREGAVSGDSVWLSISGTRDGAVKAVSLPSMQELNKNDGDAILEGELFISGKLTPGPNESIMSSSKNVVVLSKVLSMTNADPNANGTAIPIGNSRAIGQFKFSAAANNNSMNGFNNWMFSDIIFNVEAMNVRLDLTLFRMYNKADPEAKVSCNAAVTDSSAIVVTCKDLTISALNTRIDTGSSETFVLETTVMNPQVVSSSPSSLQVSLEKFSDSFQTSVGVSTSHISWLDEDLGSSTPFFWVESPETVVRSTKYGESGQGASARLDITVKQTATTDTLVKNQKNVLLQRFEGRAQNADILLTGAVFDAAQGSLTDAQNYTLWVDTDHNGSVDTILQQGVAAVSGKVTLENLLGGGYVVPKEKSVVFEVHADVSSSFLSNTLQLKFATTQANYLVAKLLSDGSALVGVQTDGVCQSTCQVTVTTAPSTIYTLRSQGDLFITKSSTPIRSRQLLGGTLADEILRLQFHAEYEDIDVTNIILTSEAPDESLFSSNVDRLELYKVGATTPFAIATVGGCATDPVPAFSMCARMQNQEFIVPKGSNTNILVRPRMKSDVDGAVSGQTVKLRVDAFVGVKARGLQSSNTLSLNDNDAVSEGEVFIGTSSPAPSQPMFGNDNVVVLSKVTSITNADPNANGTAIPTGNSRSIGQFKFSAAANNNTKNGLNKWTLTDIIFTVTAPNVQFGSDSFKIYNKADAAVKSSCFIIDYSPDSTVYYIACWDAGSSSVNTEIDQGSDATFVLQADILNAKVNNSLPSSLQVSLERFSDPSLTGMPTSRGHIQWHDKDNGASQEFWWIDYPETTINGTQYGG